MRSAHVVASFVLVSAPLTSRAQDTRIVPEPKFPSVCQVVHATLKTEQDGTLLEQGDQDGVSASGTELIQRALEHCRPGQAVRLSLGLSSGLDAFLINPLEMPQGVSLIVDGGVTVFGSRNPANYQAAGTSSTCGTIGPKGDGCKPLIHFLANSGIYGYGVVDGRGYAKMTSGPNAGKSWWELTTSLQSGQDQNIPELITADGDNFTAYKITMRHAPYYHLQWTGDGLVVWGIKIQSVWNVPNTDGINIWGTHATVRDSILSEGDDDIAIDARKIPAGDITIDHVTAYSRNGLSIGSGIAKGVSDVLIENSNLTGAVVSLKGASVNGVPFEEMRKRGITEYQQALPSRAPNIRALNIKTRPEAGGFARNITFANICIRDLNIPIEIAPYFGKTVGTHIPDVTGVTYRNIHVLAPDQQGLNRYTVNIRAYGPDKRNQITFENLVFDDVRPGVSSLAALNASYNAFTFRGNLYPRTLEDLAAESSDKELTSDGTTYRLRDNSVVLGQQPGSSTPYACPVNTFPFYNGELYSDSTASMPAGTPAGSGELTLKVGDALELKAVVEPSMSTITYFAAGVYNVKPGLLAVGAPRLTRRITFYKVDAAGKRSRVGEADLRANGTLASVRIPSLPVGTYVFSAEYPGDKYYPPQQFGHLTARVIAH